MLSNLPTDRLHIRRKPAASHHSRMKITIRTLRLAERHLHVNPNVPHHPKTLAHARPNPATSKTRYGEILRRDFFHYGLPNYRRFNRFSVHGKTSKFSLTFSRSLVYLTLYKTTFWSAGARSRFSFYGCHLALC